MEDALNKISSSKRVAPQSWKIIGVVILAPFMTLMDSTIVNVSLSTIHESLLSSFATAQWIITGYLLALALMLPLNTWLVGRFGTKNSISFASLLLPLRRSCVGWHRQCHSSLSQ